MASVGITDKKVVAYIAIKSEVLGGQQEAGTALVVICLVVPTFRLW
jgi:hypothetical protein